jgi:DNA-binding MarR family transcriptional regulator
LLCETLVVEAGALRRPDPKDRRGKLIVLTDRGKRLIDEAIGRHVANEERLLLSLTRVEQER